jgi:hypothetical protein
MKYLALLFLLLKTMDLQGQEYVYVNTNNLVMRDRPLARYMVLAVFDAPTRLEILPYTSDYVKNKAVKDKFYYTVCTVRYEHGYSQSVYGWVEKRYVVPSLAKVRVPGADTLKEIVGYPADDVDYGRDDGGDGLRHPNAANYPPPKFKGGELQHVKKRAYHLGPHGGCYYLTEKDRKVYVDSKFCK